MKFRRNARIFRGQLDAAPFVGVLFLLMIFLVLAALVYAPGFNIALPEASAGISGVEGRIVALAMDKNGRLYYDSQLIEKDELRTRLRKLARESTQPLTLVMLADKDSTFGNQVGIAELMHDPEIHIREVRWQTLPRLFDNLGKNSAVPAATKP